MDIQTTFETTREFTNEPSPNWPILQWLRGSASAGRTGKARKVMLVDPTATDDALVLKNWRCDVTVMFSQRFAAAKMYPDLNSAGIKCINADFFDLAQSWADKFDLIVVSQIELLPVNIRQIAIRMYTNCLAKGGRIIIVAPEEALAGNEMRAAQGILRPLYHETVFDPAGEGFYTVIAAERSSMVKCGIEDSCKSRGNFPA